MTPSFRHNRSVLSPQSLVLVLALLVAGLNAADRGFLPGARKHRLYIATTRHAEAAAFLSRIPPGDVVTAQDNLVPHLTHRLTVYFFAYGFTPPVIPTDPPPEWVLMDVTLAADRGDGRSLEREAYADPAYGVVAADNGYLLLRRGLTGKELPPAFTRFALAEAGDVAHPDPATSRDGRLAYLGTTVTWQPDPWSRRGWEATITSYWQALAPLERDLRFVVADSPDASDPLYSLPPTAVWFPTSHWPTGQVVRVVHGNLVIREPRTLTITVRDPDLTSPAVLTVPLVLMPPRASGVAAPLDDLLAVGTRMISGR